MSSRTDDQAEEALLDPESTQDEHSRPSLQRINTADDDYLSDSEHSRIRKLLYVSHFLSTWNSRVFEFGAFLFLANIYPQTLLPASVYALARAGSAAIVSPWLGPYIDRANRLKAVRISIVGQRLAVAASCVGLFLMAQFDLLRKTELYANALLAVLSVLACVEKLSSVLNTISVERDWVVTVAAGHEQRLTLMNAQMRRIDLFCKLIGPLAIAFIDGASSRIAILATGAMTAISVLVEYLAIARVYRKIKALQEPKNVALHRRRSSDSVWSRLKSSLSGTAIYLQHPALLPSFSLALLYLTVLSFSGQMITYLIALGLSSGLIGGLRSVSALFELSATWIAPKVTSRIGPIRAGIWFINWEIFCVVIACAFFWLDYDPTIAAIGTVSAVIASRIGLWGFDLSAQIIIQEEVEERYRGTFSSQEFALQNVFEMLAFASTIVFPYPSQFRYPATVTAGAVGLAGVLYAAFVRSRRGHLIHFSRCIDRNGRNKDHHHWWTRVPDEENADEVTANGEGVGDEAPAADDREYSTLS
ncbi:Solute carrier family 40 member 1 [Pseudocercospora fuligena]|uniref:Solute carrier family 40 member n=1 Tax=Pseudocercospora fuligena TaxID=685502 RepID=A0A8H6RT65_9PEZI|nr:Solute carrier family 40 member 1 [Pseudocercospora fuligena]